MLGYPLQILIGYSPYGLGIKDAKIELPGRHRYRLHHVMINNDSTTNLEEAYITFFAKLSVDTDVDLEFIRLAEGRATYRDGLHTDRAIDVEGPCTILGQVNHEAVAIVHSIRAYVEMLGK